MMPVRRRDFFLSRWASMSAWVEFPFVMGVVSGWARGR
jgi:3-oxoacyl-ACP reductase-like protein